MALQVVGSKFLLFLSQNSPTSSGRPGTQAKALHAHFSHLACGNPRRLRDRATLTLEDFIFTKMSVAKCPFQFFVKQRTDSPHIVVQNRQESGRKYWATCSSIRLFTRTAQCSLIHSLTHSLPSSRERERTGIYYHTDNRTIWVGLPPLHPSNQIKIPVCLFLFSLSIPLPCLFIVNGVKRERDNLGTIYIVFPAILWQISQVNSQDISGKLFGRDLRTIVSVHDCRSRRRCRPRQFFSIFYLFFFLFQIFLSFSASCRCRCRRRRRRRGEIRFFFRREVEAADANADADDK